MFRNVAAGIARRVRPTTRASAGRHQQVRWAGGGNVPDIAHNVNEPLGMGFWATIAIIPAFAAVYQLSRPAADGDMNWLTRKVYDYQVEMNETWEDRNIARTQAIEQAAHDKHLFRYANMGQAPYHEPRYPDALWAACPRNVPAGHFINVDHVVEHYRQKYHQEELRKSNKMAAKEQPS